MEHTLNHSLWSWHGIFTYLLCCRYEEDPILGHRLYREIRRVEYVKEPTKKTKGKGSVPVISYQWEAVASNFEQFSTVAVSFGTHHMHFFRFCIKKWSHD